MNNTPIQSVVPLPPESRAESARVENPYESLDAVETKKLYDELNDELNDRANTVIHTLTQMVPYLAQMQSLLSQRGARKKVLKKAGLPRWTEWAESYAGKFDCSVRTIQDRIKLFRLTKDGGEPVQKRGTSSGEDNPLRLNHRQQSALVKAQLAANDIVAALKNDGDWQTPLAEYEKVAVTPAKLDSFINALKPETDWKDVLMQLVAKLEQYGDRLPIAVITEVRATKGLLGGKTGSPTSVALQSEAHTDKLNHRYSVVKRREPNSSRILHAVIRDDDKTTYAMYDTESEAEDICKSLNSSPVASIRDSSQFLSKAS